jgi:adenine phosphoribosyltransferase
LGIPLVLVRKPGKLPGETVRIQYGLEYGSDALEIKSGLLATGARIAVIDDVLATGGTAQATGELLTKVGGVVSSYLFLVELVALHGREKLGAAKVSSLLQY